MHHLIRIAGLAAGIGLATDGAHAQDKLKVGLLLTLSGPSAVLGQQARDGFQLAVKEMGGKLGGREVEVVVVDDELKPDVAVTKVKGLLERDKVDFVVGPIFSNVAVAVHKPIVDAQTFYISVNAGPSNLAGKSCNPYFYATSYQNDQNHEVLGKVAQDRGYKKVYLLAPNYQAGKDALAGFKRHYKGEVVEESYVPLNNLDFQSELAKIASMQPDAIFTFMPGGMGVNLVKQYRAAGSWRRSRSSPPSRSTNRRCPAQQDAAIGAFGGSNWAPNLDTAENKRFVAVYEAAYNSVPGSYSMHAYDTALLIDAALKATGGKTDNKDAVRAALKKAEFKSLRGDFKFGANGFPVQDFYLVKAAKRADGKFQTEIVQKVFDDFADAYAKECAAMN
jgi:branched-chain amino acid transport system substrate-binding protein